MLTSHMRCKHCGMIEKLPAPNDIVWVIFCQNPMESIDQFVTVCYDESLAKREVENLQKDTQCIKYYYRREVMITG